MCNETDMDDSDYLMGLDALDVAGKIKVEVELVNILIFVLLGPWFLLVFNRLPLLFFL